MARSVEYDPEAVLQASIDFFWSEGYAGARIENLVAATGLNRHSLYGAFGGKDGLFLQALEQYMQDRSLVHLEAFKAETGYAALERYFAAVLEQVDPRGCLVVNTVLEGGTFPPAFKRVIESYYVRLAKCFAAAIRQGQAAGEIRGDLDPADSAEWLVRAIQGLAVSARVGFGRKPTVRSILAFLRV